MARRDVLKGLALALGGGAVVAGLPAVMQAAETGPVGYPAVAPTTADTIEASDTAPVATTASGRVRGYVRNGVVTFKGIPYADATAGANRFMPPQKAKPWTDVRSSMQFGNVCPQPPRAGWADDAVAWMFSWDDGVPGEDCLRVNLWTPAIHDGRKRPVMVWLHGGGYTAGSGQELLSYDGENLARRGDVVVVTLNHRLNVFGFLNLSHYGSQYASSANVGMLDIVAALEWVRDNIAEFGGDPNLVTIFGQSGGGGKVTALMAMPSANGLFHRAIVESGSLMRAGSEEDSSQLAGELLAKLNLDASSVEKLHDLPFSEIEAAAVAVTTHPMPRNGIIDFRHIGKMLGWGPVVDGQVLPRQPFDPDAPAQSANVPLLVGTTLNEFVSAMGHPEFMEMNDDLLKSRVHDVFADKADGVIAAAREIYPNAKPFELWSVIAVSSVRGTALTQAQRKAAQDAAPAYCYQFAWQTPVLSGTPMAFHCSEIAFVFDNTNRCENMTGGGQAARDLAARVSEAWIHFARTGDPNHSGLPHWPALTAATNATMVFDNQCEVRNNFDQKLQDLVSRD
ncbi:MAG TPA: carboxylesterase/lipase family protein [Acidobacteriaceae bacterium]|nr:carboxylesterase/lipase family protein [Acidobacteriaceae bacterium]